MMKHVLLLMGFTALATVSCSDGGPDAPGNDSSTASISIGGFEPKAGDPDWQKLKLELTKASSDKIAKEYDRSEFKDSKLNDVSIKVEYNTYRFLLAYFDKNQKLVYESCPSEKTRDHVIVTSVYEAKVKICKAGSTAPIAEVELKPSANVSIAPFFGAGQDDKIAEVVPCSQNGKALAGTDDVYGSCIDQKTSWSVQGGQIYRRGQLFPIKGANWSGLDNDQTKLAGLWNGRSIDSYLDQVASGGFNALRIPITPDVFTKTTGSDGYANPLDMLKALLKSAEARKIAILLDIHNCSMNSGYMTGTPEACAGYGKQGWLKTLGQLAELSKSYSYVVGIDLYNEPHKFTWDEWSVMVGDGAKTVLAINPKILVFVEGVGDASAFGKNNPFWGENLFEAHTKRPKVPLSRLVYSPHVYGPDVFKQTYFASKDFPKNMPAIWDEHFGYLREKGYAIVVGEFGGKYRDAADIAWQKEFVAYIAKKNLGFFYWTLNANSGDTNGLLLDEGQWEKWDTNKLQLLKPIL